MLDFLAFYTCPKLIDILTYQCTFFFSIHLYLSSYRFLYIFHFIIFMSRAKMSFIMGQREYIYPIYEKEKEE
jgi:hypothetical protein